MVVMTVAIAVAGCQTDGDERPQTAAAVAIEKADPRLNDLAEKAIARGRYRDAQRLLDRVLLADAEDTRARLLMAELHLATGSSELAAREFDELADDPKAAARALQGKGIALMRIGDNAVAYDSLRRAVDIDPTQWRAWNALGYYHDSRRNWSDADDSYQNALAANPESALIYNNRGFSMLVRRRFDEAVKDLTKALELDPDLETARLNLRLVLAWRGRYSRAMLGVSKKEMGKALNNVGFVALLRGDYTTAESYFLRAMESDASFNKAAWRNLGYLKSLNALPVSPLPAAASSTVTPKPLAVAVANDLGKQHADKIMAEAATVRETDPLPGLPKPPRAALPRTPDPKPAAEPTMGDAAGQLASLPATAGLSAASPPPNPKSRPRNAARANYRVQLHALDSDAAVRREWRRLQERHGALFSGLKLTVSPIRTDAGAKTFYRMWLGVLSSRTQASALCRKLRQKKLSCMVAPMNDSESLAGTAREDRAPGVPSPW